MQINHFQRVSLPNDELDNIYGPLSALIGTWSGNKGVNLIAVPNQQGDFTLLVAPYSETLTVTAISSPTPNRGLTKIEELPTLMYTLSIYNSVDNSLMHVENGVWELLDPIDNGSYNLARIATVPHGDAVLALGNSSVTDGPPTIDAAFSALPTGGLPPIFGYTENYTLNTAVRGFKAETPNQYLVDYLAKQEAAGFTITETTNLFVSTANQGGITNIPSINKNAKAAALESTFWVETVLDKSTGKSFQQLQYSQNTVIEFPVTGTPAGETIQWPHVNVNTLVKQ